MMECHSNGRDGWAECGGRRICAWADGGGEIYHPAQPSGMEKGTADKSSDADNIINRMGRSGECHSRLNGTNGATLSAAQGGWFKSNMNRQQLSSATKCSIIPIYVHICNKHCVWLGYSYTPPIPITDQQLSLLCAVVLFMFWMSFLVET